MSIYGFLPEENDDSADWLEDFKISPSAILLNDAFDELLSSDSKYKEVTECAHAYLAAALTYEIFSGKFRIILNFHSELHNQLLVIFLHLMKLYPRNYLLKSH